MRNRSQISDNTWLDKTIDRIFRIVEMIIIMSLLTKLAGQVYAYETKISVVVLGWMTSYYAIEDIYKFFFNKISKSEYISDTSKISGFLVISILAFFIMTYVTRPIVLALADVPLFI
jgi:hypothetical protein